MISSTPFYNGTIRSVIVTFGYIFSNVKFQRKNGATVEQTITVPIAYSQKDKWVHSIEGNPEGTQGIYTALPRMGFEITGYSYDASRKLNKMNSVHCTTNDTRTVLATPVPYNVDISLYFATKTQEDGLQILEQILPAFAPEMVVKVNAVPSLNIVQDIPFILNSVSVQDDYEGDFETRRFVTHTLTFTAKINLFSGVSDVGVITEVEANVGTLNINNPLQTYTATQLTPTAAISEDWLSNF